MDPRHPELAVSRVKELLKQYDRIEDDIKHTVVSSKLGQLEREGGLVIQEICLVAPRIHEAMMQASRQRRYDLSRGNVYEQMREYAATAERVDEPVETPKLGMMDEETAEKILDAVEKVAPKPKKKTTKKKKAE
jgi:hypothetical protein